MEWQWIKVSRLSQEIVPENTFFIGQVFNWTKTAKGVFIGTLKDKLLELEFDKNSIKWSLTPSGTESEITSFLNLDISLPPLLNTWKQDHFFSSICDSFPGVRILKQPIFECLISFICSQNSNVSKIAQSIKSLKNTYGKRICFKRDVAWYSFPTVDELSEASVDALEFAGLGYRAKYIVKTVKKIKDYGGETWLNSLNDRKTEEIKEQLMELDGIGPKVADCILLFGFNRFEVVPIDVHMWNIAKNHYDMVKSKSLTRNVYDKVRNRFFEIFGDHAGWAHSILYAASLRKELPKNDKKPKKSKK